MMLPSAGGPKPPGVSDVEWEEYCDHYDRTMDESYLAGHFVANCFCSTCCHVRPLLFATRAVKRAEREKQRAARRK